ncbi:MAG: hypothetical protein ACFFCO_07050, partial [Promethearchaeota archaeon]
MTVMTIDIITIAIPNIKGFSRGDQAVVPCVGTTPSVLGVVLLKSVNSVGSLDERWVWSGLFLRGGVSLETF